MLFVLFFLCVCVCVCVCVCDCVFRLGGKLDERLQKKKKIGSVFFFNDLLLLLLTTSTTTTAKHTQDVNPDGTVRNAYPTRYMNSGAGGDWGGTPASTSDYVFGS